MKPRVSVVTGEPVYCAVPPFHPDSCFPELPFTDVSAMPNPAYRLLRRALADLGLDRKELGTPRWNPFAGVVREGDTVVIKPNFVLHRNAGGGPLEAVVTHPSVLRAIVNYTFIALQGHGRIIIADTPQMDCNWEELMRFERLDAIVAFYRERLRFPLEIIDCGTSTSQIYATCLRQKSARIARRLDAHFKVRLVGFQRFSGDCRPGKAILRPSTTIVRRLLTCTATDAMNTMSHAPSMPPMSSFCPKMKAIKRWCTLNLTGLLGPSAQQELRYSLPFRYACVRRGPLARQQAIGRVQISPARWFIHHTLPRRITGRSC